MDPRADALLQTWFGDWDDSQPQTDSDQALFAMWWMHKPEVDAMLEERFGALHTEACAGGCDHWADTPRGTLALVILFDQLSRNLGRGTGAMFAHDGRARALVKQAIAEGTDLELTPIERSFLYMPLMHSEDTGDHELAVEVFTRLAGDTASGPRADNYANVLDFQHKHKAIVDRFGRYPHRNELLERVSTPEERAFLEEPGSSF